VSTQARPEAVARCVLESIDDDHVVVSVPGTDYRLRLTPGEGADRLSSSATGRRVRGSIHARALRMHTATGGGRFIEPVDGAPRIVAGRVTAVDEAGDRLLVDVAVPVWVTVHAGQAAADFAVGQLVNCYVESGTAFRPIEDA
jgi:hypothetical protein